MYKLYIIILYFLLFVISFDANAQHDDIYFQHLSTNQGLPHSIVADIYQDNNGFMWFTTGNGLCKYDGYKFTVYQHDKNDPNSISENILNQIIADDKEQVLWLLGEKSIIRFDIKHEVFTSYQYPGRILQ